MNQIIDGGPKLLSLKLIIMKTIKKIKTSMSGSIKHRGATQDSSNPKLNKSHKLKAQIGSKTKSEHRLLISSEKGS
ncbi:hypothetical protein HanIR_Chr16g0831201 [Helianthus annuus]|nr:hypothetical protein HanIR_Chr16g0831201 [Helianthus annuus]